MTVLDFLRMTRASIVWLLLAVLLGAAAAFGYTMTLPRIYESTSTGFVTVSGSESSTDVIMSSNVARERAQAYLPLITSRKVASEIAKQLGDESKVDQIMGSIGASVAEGSSLIRVTAHSRDPKLARDIANSALNATASVVGQLEGSNSAVKVTPLEDALVPKQPSSPDVKRYIIIGALLGLVAGYGYAFLRQATDTRIRTESDVTSRTKSGVLGLLPKSDAFKRESWVDSEIDGQAAESIRQLRTNLRFVSVDNPPRVVLVTSSNPGEGKSTVSANLARALAESGQQTLVVDADLRKPMQSTLFDVDGSVGLTQVLSGQVTAEQAMRDTLVPGLKVLPAGRTPPNPSELLGSGRMQRLLRELSKYYFVILDAPPLLPVTDASLLSTSTDGVILVTRLAVTRKDQLEIAQGMLDKVRANVLGTVINGIPTKGIGASYYGFGYGGYRYGYGGYYSEDKKKGSKRSNRKSSRSSSQSASGRAAKMQQHRVDNDDAVAAGIPSRRAAREQAKGSQS